MTLKQLNWNKIIFRLFLVLIAIQALTFTNIEIFVIIASRLYIIQFIVFLLLAIIKIVEVFKEDMKERNFWSWIFIIVIGFLIFKDSGMYPQRFIDHESARQTAFGLEAFKHVDWQFNVGYIDIYLMRQNIILALPSLILGRTLFAQQFMFDLLGIVSILLLYAGARSFFGKLSFLPIISVLSGPFFFNFFINHKEQSMLVPAISMMALGLLALVYKQKSIINISLLTYCGIITASAYSPLNTVCMLILLFMAIMIVKDYLAPDKSSSEIKNNSLNYLKIITRQLKTVRASIARIWNADFTFVGRLGHRRTEIAGSAPDTSKEYEGDHSNLLLLSGILISMFLIASLFQFGSRYNFALVDADIVKRSLSESFGFGMRAILGRYLTPLVLLLSIGFTFWRNKLLGSIMFLWYASIVFFSQVYTWLFSLGEGPHRLNELIPFVIWFFWYGMIKLMDANNKVFRYIVKGLAGAFALCFLFNWSHNFYEPSVVFPPLWDIPYQYFADIGIEYDEMKPIKIYYSEQINFDFLQYINLYRSPNALVLSTKEPSSFIETCIENMQGDRPIIVVSCNPPNIPDEIVSKLGEPQPSSVKINDIVYDYETIIYTP